MNPDILGLILISVFVAILFWCAGLTGMALRLSDENKRLKTKIRLQGVQHEHRMDKIAQAMMETLKELRLEDTRRHVNHMTTAIPQSICLCGKHLPHTGRCNPR